MVKITERGGFGNVCNRLGGAGLDADPRGTGSGAPRSPSRDRSSAAKVPRMPSHVSPIAVAGRLVLPVGSRRPALGVCLGSYAVETAILRHLPEFSLHTHITCVKMSFAGFIFQSPSLA